jgi:hypothetical protein
MQKLETTSTAMVNWERGADGFCLYSLFAFIFHAWSSSTSPSFRIIIQIQTMELAILIIIYNELPITLKDLTAWNILDSMILKFKHLKIGFQISTPLFDKFKSVL